MCPSPSVCLLLSAVVGRQSERENPEVHTVYWDHFSIATRTYVYTHTHTGLRSIVGCTHACTHSHTHIRDFSEVLSAQKWPFSSSSLSYSLQTSDKLNKHFSVLFNLLLQLDPTSPPGDHQQQQQGEGGRMDGPLLYPLEQMIQPLRKRFRYHFTGERRTNSLEKVRFKNILDDNFER